MRTHSRPVKFQAKQSAVWLVETHAFELQRILSRPIHSGDCSDRCQESRSPDNCLGVAVEVDVLSKRIREVPDRCLQTIFNFFLGAQDFFFQPSHRQTAQYRMGDGMRTERYVFSVHFSNFIPLE